MTKPSGRGQDIPRFKSIGLPQTKINSDGLQRVDEVFATWNLIKAIKNLVKQTDFWKNNIITSGMNATVIVQNLYISNLL